MLRLIASALLIAVALSCALFVSADQQQQQQQQIKVEAPTTSDLFQLLNTFMCSTGSEHCLKMGHGEQVDWTVLKKSMVLRTLEFGHEMVVPTSVKHLAMRAMLPAELQELFKAASKLRKAPEAGASAITAHKASAAAVRAALEKMTGKSVKYPYFGWVPQEAGDSHVNAPGGISFSTSCVGNINVKAVQTGNTVAVTTSASHNGFLCDDVLLMLAGAHDFTLQVVDKEGPKTWSFDTSKYQDYNVWYLKRHGIRVLKFPKGLLETVEQILATVTLLAGYEEHVLTKATLDDNLAFLHTYTQFSPRMQGSGGALIQRRSGGTSVGVAMEDKINSGDAFIVLRPDGIDPMISWGQGTVSGHSTIAMRNSTGDLHVCESTTLDSYWPTNGIQCTPYKRWISQVERAQMTAMLTPLSAESRAKFDAKKAWAFFEAHDGVNYGFPAFLFGWVDTPKRNFPCVPPDFTTCLEGDVVEQLALMLDRLQGASLENIFRWAINHRTNTTGMTVIQAFYSAVMRNPAITFPEIYSMPEQDSWKYNMSLNNGSTTMTDCSVCCVFVCKMWKAAGIFSSIEDEINCGEQALWDIFSMKIFDPATTGENRPEICKQADPKTPLCIVAGVFDNFPVPDWNTRVPYSHMGEKCSSMDPEYIREPGC